MHSPRATGHLLLAFVVFTVCPASAQSQATADERQVLRAPFPRNTRREFTVTLPGGVPLVLVRVPAGTFLMGAPETDDWANHWERPQHQVTLTSDYLMGKYLVTQGQWKALMGTNPSYHDYCGDDCPVDHVSWNDIAAGGGFLERLNAHLAATGQAGAGALRLPTEAEWERAARGGTQTRFPFGDVSGCDWGCLPCPEAEPYVWWCANSEESTRPVGSNRPNPYGLYDMHGNLWELLADWYGDFTDGAQTDPKGPPDGVFRVIKGGAWKHELLSTRPSSRYGKTLVFRHDYVGFRVAADLFAVIPRFTPDPEAARPGADPSRR